MTNKGTPGLRGDFCPYHDSYPGIELQVPPTPQLKGERMYCYRPYGSRDDSWLPVVSGNLCPIVGSIQVLEKENVQPDLLQVRLAEVKKKKKKNPEKTAVLIKAVYEMIDKMATPVTSLEFTVTVFFLGLELKKGLSVIFKVR